MQPELSARRTSKWNTLFVFCLRKKVENFVCLLPKKKSGILCFFAREKSGVLCLFFAREKWNTLFIFSQMVPPPQICHPAKCEDEVKKDCQTVEKDKCKIENVVELVDK